MDSLHIAKLNQANKFKLRGELALIQIFPANPPPSMKTKMVNEKWWLNAYTFIIPNNSKRTDKEPITWILKLKDWIVPKANVFCTFGFMMRMVVYIL